LCRSSILAQRELLYGGLRRKEKEFAKYAAEGTSSALKEREHCHQTERRGGSLEDSNAEI